MRRKAFAWISVAATALATALPVTAQEEPLEPAPIEDSEEAREKVGRGLEPADVSQIDQLERQQKIQALGTGPELRTYLVRLVDDAIPTYDGGVAGLAPTAPEPGEQLDPASAPVRDYQDFLVEAQVELITRIDRIAGRDVEIPFTYQFAVNGFAAVLTPEEAAEVSLDPSVASISPDEERELHTDRGPQWIGADSLWNADPDLGLPADIRGEGIVIGTIDTGISPGNQSFADPAPGDGYDHENPYGEFLGVCNPDNPPEGGGFDEDFLCNDKLVGAYVFGGANDSAVDYDGHGSHTASTSGGNVVEGVVVEAAELTTQPFDISGVAPHANVISYLGCCTLSGLTAAIDQAIVDEVDVINYSIGSPAPSQLWNDFDTVGFLNARASGIFVATSNGNAGPFFASTGSPSDAPWITSVGASTHDRHNGNALIELSSSAGTLDDIAGKSTTGPLESSPIVYAGDIGDPLCGPGAFDYTGMIVVCERGVFGRVEKSQNVADQGAAGFVLINDEPNADSLLDDTYALPGVFISFDDGQVLKDWLATGSDHVAAVAGTEFTIDEQFGDIMASFSSRGPNRAVDILVPDVTAPGVDVLAALHDTGAADPYAVNVHGFISGTSMASPHVAGAGALLSQARPDWTPAEMQSALMTSARTSVLDHDGEPATPYEQGSGHINVDSAAKAGLLFDETFANYIAANPAEGGDPKTLNLPSFANTQCLAVCSWQRTASVPDDAEVPAGVTWTASTTSDDGLSIDVSLSDATLSPGDTTAISVTANAVGAPEGDTLFGRITLTPDSSDVPAVTMPLAVVPASAVLPGEVEFTTRRNAGSHLVTGIQSLAITEFAGSMLGMVPGTLDEGELNQDPTRGDPYDDLSQVDVYTIDVPAGSPRLVAESIEAEMPDLDLFVGQGATPSLATQVCASTTPTAIENCDIADPEPGTWWVLIQNWGGSDAQPDAYVLSTAVVPSDDLGNAGVEGPSEPVPVGEPYDVTVHWDIPEMTVGDRWYGTAVLGSSPSTPGDVGTFPVTIVRVEDDVSKTASSDQASPGDTISYEITVQPNVTSQDLTYTITDTVPDGLTIDPASVTGGGVVDGQTISWEVDVPTPVGVVGDYELSTPSTSQQCLDWSGFLDLGTLPTPIPFNPLLDGDSIAVTAFSGIGPFEHYGGEFPNLVVAEDGLITMTGGYGGFPFLVQTIPNAEPPNGVLTPLWSDLELSVADNRGMRLAQAGDVAVIQWDDPFEWTPDSTIGPSVGKFQAWIYTTVEDFRPEMTFEYDTLGELPATATIGTENILGDLATAALNAGDPATLLEEDGTICLDYTGPSFDPITVGYDVTVDTDAEPGTYTNEVVHVTDDPFAQPATTSTDVEIVEPQADLAVVKTGEVADGQIIFTVEVTNNGPDDATGVVVTDELPAGVTYVSDSCGGANAPPWTWDIGDLAAGDTVECAITVDPGPSGSIENTATVAADQEDPDPANNESTVTVDFELACTETITGRHVGPLNVSEGVTCLDGARITGPVSVDEGAALLSDDGSRLTGGLNSDGALEISLCDTRVTGPVSLDGSSKVTLGDPTVDCEGNRVTGGVTVNGTDGPSVIADNRIVGPLSCRDNEPPPVNNGFPNSVVGPTRGQCSDL